MSRTDRVVDGVTAMILDGRLGPGQRLPVEKDLADALGVSRGSLREGIRALAVLGVVETRQGDGTYVTALDPGSLVAPLGLVVELQAAGHALHVHTVRRLLETEVAGLAAAGARAPGADLTAAREALAQGAAVLARAGSDDPATSGEGESGDGEPGDVLCDHEALLAADLAFHRALGALAGNPVLAALTDAMGGRTARHRLSRGVTEPGAEARTQREHEAILDAVAAGDVDRARVRMAAHLLAVEDFLRTDAG
ncbi:MAG: FadR family transcriptional regulator [Cellulomonas sp.]|jgi:GntR family transcriptional regulator, transcriptional repressor for pyruvate dehydrogenase complex|uniref:FadR/GntR family transcriptional regulator n=1 Tax=Cellulomonas sp. TaxID=40001 RepID=UPI0019DFE0CA|nr:FCD domain-containing protein [Cellulomonas sp.]MBF0686566.1 FadR family transcriptional regulator [Cellulomonas sp.]